MSVKALNSTSILIVDDNPENLDILIEHLQGANFNVSVALTGEKGLEIAEKIIPDLILLDIHLPGIDGFEMCCQLKQEPLFQETPVIFISIANETVEKVKGFSVGGVDYITKPFEYEEVLARINLHLTLHRQQQQLIEKNAELLQINEQLQQEIARREQAEQALSNVTAKLSAISQEEAQRWGLSAFIGKSLAITPVLNEVRRLQQVDKTNVLILGESGTGKELIARAIHFGGTRSKGPFVPVNCSAIPENLAESSFFGHNKGAFTGASNSHQGYFEQAQGGSLFLDEIGDMPLFLQSKLLRALESGVITPVGSQKDRQVNVRIMAATSVDLLSKVNKKQFREDLYFRLASYTVIAPPLRKRKEDIVPLADYFLSVFAREMGYKLPKLTPQVQMVLTRYHFPGNVRELKNIMEHALIKSDGYVIEPHHLYFVPFINKKMVVNQMPDGEVEYSVHLSPDEKNIIDYVAKKGSINNAQCRQLLNSDLHRASYLLKKMYQEGLLIREGKLRWAVYRLNVE